MTLSTSVSLGISTLFIKDSFNLVMVPYLLFEDFFKTILICSMPREAISNLLVQWEFLLELFEFFDTFDDMDSMLSAVENASATATLFT